MKPSLYSPLYSFMKWCLIMHRDNVTFTIMKKKEVTTVYRDRISYTFIYVNFSKQVQKY